MVRHRRLYPFPITPESLAYWFFRINGCLTTVNFAVHPDLVRHDENPGMRTDADILAVRFPFRAELLTSGNPMADHWLFAPDDGLKIDFVISEVKKGLCRLNGPWTIPDRENMQRVLYAIGMFPPESIDDVAEEIYANYAYEDEEFRVRLVAVGGRWNRRLPDTVIQLTWDDEILPFIHQRFTEYRDEKADHNTWDDSGQYLFDSAQMLEQSEYTEWIQRCLDT